MIRIKTKSKNVCPNGLIQLVRNKTGENRKQRRIWQNMKYSITSKVFCKLYTMTIKNSNFYNNYIVCCVKEMLPLHMFMVPLRTSGNHETLQVYFVSQGKLAYFCGNAKRMQFGFLNEL